MFTAEPRFIFSGLKLCHLLIINFLSFHKHRDVPRPTRGDRDSSRLDLGTDDCVWKEDTAAPTGLSGPFPSTLWRGGLRSMPWGFGQRHPCASQPCAAGCAHSLDATPGPEQLCVPGSQGLGPLGCFLSLHCDRTDFALGWVGTAAQEACWAHLEQPAWLLVLVT